MNVLCIDVGGTFIKFAVMNERNELGEVKKIATPMDTLEHFIKVIVHIYQRSQDVIGIALSMPGIIEPKSGYMMTGGSLQYIKNLDLADKLSEACDQVPVSIENDAKAAAIAELEEGVLKECNNAIVLTIGTALGGTIIINREVLRGKNLFAGELSYLIFDTTEKFHILDKKRRLWNSHGVPAQICNLYGEENINTEEILVRLSKGDKKAEEAVRKSTQELAMLLHNLQCIIDPDVIAIGGGISSQEQYISILQEEVDALDVIGGPHPVIKACRFGNNANMLGAYHFFCKKYNEFI